MKCDELLIQVLDHLDSVLKHNTGVLEELQTITTKMDLIGEGFAELCEALKVHDKKIGNALLEVVKNTATIGDCLLRVHPDEMKATIASIKEAEGEANILNMIGDLLLRARKEKSKDATENEEKECDCSVCTTLKGLPKEYQHKIHEQALRYAVLGEPSERILTWLGEQREEYFRTHPDYPRGTGQASGERGDSEDGERSEGSTTPSEPSSDRTSTKRPDKSSTPDHAY